MYLYMGLLAVIPGIIYFTFFINRLLRTILNIHTNWFLIIIIGLVIMVLSIPAMNTLELYRLKKIPDLSDFIYYWYFGNSSYGVIFRLWLL